MRAKFTILYYMMIFFAIGLTVLAVSTWINFLHNPIIQAEQQVIYVLKPGTSVRQFAEDLQQIGQLAHTNYFVAYVKLKRQEAELQAGKYQFTGPLTPSEILQIVVSGEVLQAQITLVEGWRFQDLMQAVREHSEIEQTLQDKTPQQIMHAIGAAEQHYEGMFYPETYHFPSGTQDVAVYKRAYQAMQNHLGREWAQRQENLPYANAYQALIAASLVEKETAIDAERPMVAGVLVRRLQKGMLLQFDPTVIYGLQEDYDGQLLRKHLSIPNPYNTYLSPGLPPTPIAMPSLLSIRAALNPDDSDNLYFVATGDGGHIFSKTLDEHNKAVRDYRRKSKMVNELP
jgi:UPF0755 protein